MIHIRENKRTGDFSDASAAFEDQIKKVILERGKENYLIGRAIKMKETGETIHADFPAIY
ncbi:hypothetical protein NCCP133_21660 [Cytobacillus sp. NCCP-133]|nr:hypothetical protein NCCP133_21660 [Cytobacillus sp. NCCP-133]